MGALLKYTAFTTDPHSGNPAGVWIGDALPPSAEMQQIAAEVGYSETVFIAPTKGKDRTVRYYSPAAEVNFCGHATIAAGVVLGQTQGAGTYRFAIRPGEVPVTVHKRGDHWQATLTSVTPSHGPVPTQLLEDALELLGWRSEELDRSIPPAVAFAGARHLVLPVAKSERLAQLDYNFDSLKALMLDQGLTTLQLIWRERSDLYHSRNPFPVGGVFEDPATGAAAAAFAGYLRDASLLAAPTRLVIRQGEAMGRPSTLFVEVPVMGGINVSGTAVPVAD
jgi:PhzF family phenazine biosynthesis protein